MDHRQDRGDTDAARDEHVAIGIGQREIGTGNADVDDAAGPQLTVGFHRAAATVGQLQHRDAVAVVLDYSTLDAGLAILPAAAGMVVVAPRSAKLVNARGARFTLLIGYVFCLLGFLVMLLLWKEDIAYWKVGLGYALIGIGVGFAGTPASHSLTGSVPVRRAGMASGTADLQRDLGGAIMQSILGAVLTAGYASAISTAVAGSPDKDKVTDQVQAELQKSFSSAANVANQYPQYKSQIIAAAKTSFLQGDEWAYIAGIVAILLGAALVFFLFPGRRKRRNCCAATPPRTRPDPHAARASFRAAARRASARCTRSARVPPATSIVTLMPRTARAPTALSLSPSPAATPRYAEAGIVVTEIATPTAELARLSSASMPAMPATSATTTVELLTVVSPCSGPSPRTKPSGSRFRRSRSAGQRAGNRAGDPSPTASVTNARRTSRWRPRVRPTHIAVIGSRSGLTAMAPTIRMLFS